MAKIMNKKAIVFTLIAILAVSLLLMYVRPTKYMTLENRVPVIKNRVITTNDFFRETLTSHTEDIVKVASSRAMASYILYLNTTAPGKPRGFAPGLIDLINDTAYIAMNGSDRHGTNISLAPYSIDLMQEHTISGQISRFNKITREYLLINSSIEVTNLVFYQNNDTGPWRIGANYTVAVEMNDSMASWNQSRNSSINFDINGYVDPYILLKSSYPKIINATNITYWNLTNFEKHMNISGYIAEQNGISFLARFYDGVNGSNPCCGIETLIPQDDRFKLDSGDYYNRSFIDYCYLSDYCSGSLYKVNESNSDIRSDFSSDVNLPHADKSYPFRIEPFHYSIYGLTHSFEFDGSNHSVLVRD